LLAFILRRMGESISMCNWKKWIWPGLVAVAIVTALSTWLRTDIVQNDLTAKALQQLQDEHPWADVSLDGRDLTLTGTSPSPEDTQEALDLANTAYDVRIVSDATELLASVSPYPLSVTKEAESIILAGNVPNDDVRAEITEIVQKAMPEATIVDQMTLARGQGDNFVDLAEFGITELSGLTQGTVSLSDSDLSIEGTASSFEIYNSTVSTLAGTIPADGNLVSSKIIPPAASPYEWMANYDGTAVVLSGFVPSSEASDAIEATVREQLPEVEVTNELQVAQGAPDNFVDAANYATGFFPGFTQGRASYNDTAFTISGVAKSPAEFESAIANLPNLTSGYELAENNIQPVGVSPYEWNATQNGETIVLSGFAPGTAVRDRIEATARSSFPAAEIDNRLEIAGGETAQYDPATLYSFDMLQRFTEGEARLVDNNLTISGRAKTLDDYDAALAAVEDIPEGITLDANVLPPFMSPYRFSAVKADNNITLSGFVQSEDERATVVGIVRQDNPGFQLIDELRIADGVPDGVTWPAATAYGLRQLGELDNGSMSIIDGAYTISGNAPSIAVRDNAVGSIQSGLAGGMQLANEAIVAPEPEPEPEPQIPLADPYRWTVSKTDEGVSVSGNIADRADGDGIVSIVKSSLGVADLEDNQIIASGKPEGFDTVRRIVTNQVKRLEAGQGNIVGTTVSVIGRASDKIIADEIKSSISNALPAGYTGTTNILFPEPEPEPEPAAPTADPYRWSVSKQPSGIVVRGNVMDEAAKTATMEMVNITLGAEAEDRQTIALGKPDGFDDARALVTAQLRLLEAGQGNVVGNTLSVSGRAKNENIKNLVDKTVQNRLPAGFTGSTNILFPKPEPAPVPEPPSVDAEACQTLISNAIGGQKILFETDKAVIKAESEAVLNAVAEAAEQCPSVRMEISGHTDSRGRDAYNQELSEARANSVRTYLVNAGIAASRLDASGFGETQPIASNRNPDGRAQNRRIEFNVIK